MSDIEALERAHNQAANRADEAEALAMEARYLAEAEKGNRSLARAAWRATLNALRLHIAAKEALDRLYQERWKEEGFTEPETDD